MTVHLSVCSRIVNVYFSTNFFIFERTNSYGRITRNNCKGSC